MFDPFALAMLAIESQRVFELRMTKLACGGAAAHAEARQMVSEKLDALFEASGTLMMGGSYDAVVARYREHVAANAQRLTTV